jgi:hypothetical protein
VEVKSIEAIAPVDKKQLLTYLRITDKKLGILINFNVEPYQEWDFSDRKWVVDSVSRAKTRRTTATLCLTQSKT